MKHQQKQASTFSTTLLRCRHPHFPQLTLVVVSSGGAKLVAKACCGETAKEIGYAKQQPLHEIKLKKKESGGECDAHLSLSVLQPWQVFFRSENLI